MRKIGLVVVVVVVIFGVAIFLASGGEKAEPSENKFGEPTENVLTVVKVVDGDTVDVRFPDGSEDRVRMVGIDTPEIHGEAEPEEYEGIDDPDYLREWGVKAKGYTTGRLLNEEVELKSDKIAGERGYYGRLLAYIIIDNTNFNLELVERGYARAYTEADCELLDNLVEAEFEARAEGRGLWGILENEGAEKVFISHVHYDAAGDDRYNLNDEYLVVSNDGPSVDLSDWTLSDDAGHTFTFPSGFTLPSGESVTVYTGSGTNTGTELYWNSGAPIWNNSSDTAFLENPIGDLVDEEAW